MHVRVCAEINFCQHAITKVYEHLTVSALWDIDENAVLSAVFEWLPF